MTVNRPAAWRNWRMHDLSGDPTGAAFEHGFYSDAYIVGDVLEPGPYSLINALNFNTHLTGHVGRVVTLRIKPYIELAMHTDPGAPSWAQTDTSRYHGGGLEDEIAALLGLALGTRCRSGGVTRTWFMNDDPLGWPVEIDHAQPDLSPPAAEPSASPNAAARRAETCFAGDGSQRSCIGPPASGVDMQ